MQHRAEEQSFESERESSVTEPRVPFAGEINETAGNTPCRL